MANEYSDLDASIQGKIDADNDFQDSLVDLSDEDKTAKLNEKRTELFNNELSTLKEKADKFEKSDEIAKNQKTRAEKAEEELKKGKLVTTGEKKPEEKKTGDLSSKDIFAIMNAKVAEEDIDEVVDYAKFKGISVGEALKTSTIKATLSERDEQRKTAMATNTGAARRGSSSASVESLLNNAAKGDLPESDKDIERLMQAKFKQGRK